MKKMTIRIKKQVSYLNRQNDYIRQPFVLFMKLRITFIIVLMYVGLTCKAQHIVASYKNGNPFHSNSVMLVSDTCSFSLDNGASGNWTLYVYSRKENVLYGEPPITVKCLEKKQIEKLELPAKNVSTNWNRAVRYEIEGDSSCYFKGVLCCEMADGTKDSMFVMFNFLPSKPKFKELHLTYDGFDFENWYLINPLFNAVLESERAEHGDNNIALLHLLYDDNGIGYEVYPKECWTGDNTFVIKDGYWDYDTYLFLKTSNMYGASLASDTLDANDFITDQAILDALNGTTGIDKTEANKAIDVYVSNGYLSVTNTTDMDIRRVIITNLSGQTVVECCNKNKISLSALHDGLYIVRIITTDNLILTKKIRM